MEETGLVLQPRPPNQSNPLEKVHRRHLRCLARLIGVSRATPDSTQLTAPWPGHKVKETSCLSCSLNQQLMDLKSHQRKLALKSREHI